ncbi:hypothetical protein DM01DRAFT_1381973 [Hesseltinella vesiculosa]|uniref:F-box domain-containing protein n=1 Tax=Hesseltinella vesiculosa TaxID=101127 RepID=A0A1X2GMN7_9FUNG|nr:hypothetical protein DM01DRAFT_1381973 [Hesseltinella vesiculosa]
MCCTCRSWYAHFAPDLYRQISLDVEQPGQLAAALARCDARTTYPQGHATQALDFSSLRPLDSQHISLLDTIAVACPFINTIRFDSKTFHQSIALLGRQESNSPDHVSSTSTEYHLHGYTEAISQRPLPSGPLLVPTIALIFSKLLFHRHAKVRTLDFTFAFDEERVQDVASFLHAFPAGLESLTLDVDRYELTFAIVELIHERFPLLNSLSLQCIGMAHITTNRLATMKGNRTIKSFSLTADASHPYAIWSWVWYAGKKYGRQLEAARFHNGVNSHLLDHQQQNLIIHTFIPAFIQQHASTLRSLEMKNMAFRPDFWHQMTAQLQETPTKLVNLKWSDNTRSIFRDEYAPLEIAVAKLIVGLLAKPTIQQLHLSLSPYDNTFDGYFSCLGQFPRLCHFHLQTVEGSRRVHQLLQHCPGLKQLSLTQYGFHIGSDRFDYRHSLTTLTLYASSINCQTMNKLLQCLPSLETLSIRGSTTFFHQVDSNALTHFEFAALTLSVPNPNMSIRIDREVEVYIVPSQYQISGHLQLITLANAQSAIHRWLTGGGTVARLPDHESQQSLGLPSEEIDRFPTRFGLFLKCDHPIRELKYGSSTLVRRGIAVKP